jgi:uncharacterized protein (TIGR00730 family)
MQRVCVFSGSRAGVRPGYATAARDLGAEIARAGMELVYGGASVGLMREAADAALAAGGRVIGVIPRALVDREIAHPGLTELRVVGSMHERKATMSELADAFVALPGGFGTLDELFEILTWSQLGLHAKPVGLLVRRGVLAASRAARRAHGAGRLHSRGPAGAAAVRGRRRHPASAHEGVEPSGPGAEVDPLRARGLIGSPVSRASPAATSAATTTRAWRPTRAASSDR